MAELHGRVPRLPHPQLRAWIVGAAVASFALTAVEVRAQVDDDEAVAEATDPRLQRVEALAAELGAEDAEARSAAASRLGHLVPEDLPAIRARVARISRVAIPERVGFDLFNRFRRAAGSTRADDDTDVEAGVLPTLAEERGPHARAMAEAILLMRALERQESFEASRAMLPLIGLYGDNWRWEGRRYVGRVGRRALPAAIVARSHPNQAVKTWSRWAIPELGATSPGLAVQGLEPEVLADVLRAYAMVRTQSAMPVIVSFIGHERRRVRAAARWAIERYGGNAIWVLRTAYHHRTGEHAPREWGIRRVRSELYGVVDAARLAPVRAAREAGLAALAEGRLDDAEAAFDDVLARAPEPEAPEALAEALGTIAAAHLAEDRLAAAQRSYRRALRLAPEHPAAEGWRAELAFLEAESRLLEGVWDEDGYAAALALDPSHRGAARALAPAEAEVAAIERRRGAAWAGSALLALVGLLVLWPARRRRRARIGEGLSEEESNEDAPNEDSTLDSLEAAYEVEIRVLPPPLAGEGRGGGALPSPQPPGPPPDRLPPSGRGRSRTPRSNLGPMTPALFAAPEEPPAAPAPIARSVEEAPEPETLETSAEAQRPEPAMHPLLAMIASGAQASEPPDDIFDTLPGAPAPS